MRDIVKWKLDALNEGAAKWDPNVDVIEQLGALYIRPLANTSGSHYNGYVSVGSWDLTDAQASVKVPQATNVASFADTVLAIGIDNNNWYRIVQEGGQLYFQAKISGAKTSTNIAYNQTSQGFWRIRHNPATDQIVFETSNNRINWTVQRSVVRSIPDYRAAHRTRCRDRES